MTSGRLLLAAGLVAVVAAACGGSSGGAGNSDTPPSLNQDHGPGRGWVDYGASCYSGNCVRKLHVFNHDCLLAIYNDAGAGFWCEPLPAPTPSPSPIDFIP